MRFGMAVASIVGPDWRSRIAFGAVRIAGFRAPIHPKEEKNNVKRKLFLVAALLVGIAATAAIPAKRAHIVRTPANVLMDECCSDPICQPGDPPPCPPSSGDLAGS